jgi:uncharacterized protein YbgA (DUF1722 family)/uncharacterized protein YbbK (DUF523 family)
MENQGQSTVVASSDAIRIGISSCLLGEKVRYDGGHKEDRFLTGTLSRYFEWVPVCPEVELGLGTPRESIRLENSPEGVRLVATKSGKDLTGAMRTFSRARIALLEREGLCGYILKKDSPSCGLHRVRVHGEHAAPSRSGRGLFAEALAAAFPSMPIEEEGRLSDPRLRENWIERVFAYRRLRSLWESRWRAADLIRFHTGHKLILLAHSPGAYEKLGRIVAEAGRTSRQKLQESYEREFMAALVVPATRGRHVNVLQHMSGYFKKQLDGDSKAELAQVIEDYRLGAVPLLVPLTLIKHHIRRLGVQYLEAQLYLNPHPKELALRAYV